MDNENIDSLVKDLIAEKKQVLQRLEKINKALVSLRALYPDAFTAMQEAEEKLRFAGVQMKDLPLRTKVKAILKQQGAFTKVGELARIALEQEPEGSMETFETMQDKISRTLTALKKIPSAQIEKRKISSGSTGFAWGFSYWQPHSVY